jgi:DNA adenine methylase
VSIVAAEKFIRSFLKWPGGKYRILDKIIPILPPGQRFIEPFAGSCVVSLNTDYPEYVLTDANKRLIEVHKHIHDGYFNRDSLRELFQNGNNKAEFERLREQFNGEDNCCTRALLFVYLNRHCFNGLWRCNASGKFNVPFGKYKTIYLPTKEVEFFAEKFSGCSTIRDSNFIGTMSSAHRGDVVYCDPPYVPLSPTASFTKYTPDGFTDKDHENLADCAKSAAATGAVVLISNHDTEFTRELYKEAHIISFEVRRSISAKAASRKNVRELIAIY